MTDYDPLGVAHRAADLTPDWLTAALGIRLLDPHVVVVGVDASPVGTGQVADTLRLALTYDPPEAGPPSVVAKIASSDERSRGAGLMLRLYEVETALYADVPDLPGIPRCFYSAYDATEGWFTLLLADATPAVAGDDFAGCDPVVAEAALRRLAEIHAHAWDRPDLADLAWLDRTTPESTATTAGLVAAVGPGFLDRFADRMSADHADLVRRFVPSFPAWIAGGDDGPRTIQHGDYRLDNMLFAPGDPTPTVVDWQTCVWGHPAVDVAYFLGGSLTPETRREHQERLLDAYHETLVAQGVSGYSRQQLDEDVRYRTVSGVVMAVAASMLVVPTERGDAMFAESLRRHAEHVLDRDAEAVWPAPTGGLVGHVVDAADEGRHAPGPEELWNESWYADVTAGDGSDDVGAYVRLGLYPNLDRAWLHVIVCGPGRPLAAIAAYDLPIPADGEVRVAAGGLAVSLEPEDALRSFAVRIRGTARTYAEPADVYRDDPIAEVPLELAATWRTDGVPYHYDLTTRYEIPCAVEGSVTVDGETVRLDGPGQRDHSWGVRDWWSFGWCWAAARLDDGERLHVADIRLPETRLPFGYRQHDGAVTPVTSLDVTEEVDADGFATTGRIVAQGLDVAVTPLAWGPALLPGPDGAFARFPRAYARFDAVDGRSGTGWIEWNQPVGDA